MSLALVTGASAGIGLHIAHEFAGRGYDVVAVAFSARIHGVAEQIPGVEVTPVQADLTTDEGIETVWSVYQELGRDLDAPEEFEMAQDVAAYRDAKADDDGQRVTLDELRADPTS
ncbi:MAG: SDR family NAD(P)-dependent oxidoreductase [Propionibacteriaceae bacterium]|nr:SDR family NAD(P)-dependent oxidoreductase [Propionibacteriaceae bacterium]